MRSTLLALLLIICTGCPGGGGTCSTPDSLFPSPMATGVRTDAGVQVDVTWMATSAPAAFYAAPQVTGAIRVLDAGATGVRVLSTTSPSPLEFDLRYSEGPARTCSHVGMDDTFVLSVSLLLLSDGGVGGGRVTTDVQLGAL